MGGGSKHLVHLVADVEDVCTLRLPVELGHAAIPHQRCKECGEVVARNNDGHSLHQVRVAPHLVHRNPASRS